MTGQADIPAVPSNPMKNILIYLFWPNPGLWNYSDPKVIAMLITCGVIVVGSFAVGLWRGKMQNPRTRSLSKSWPAAMLWFGIVGIVLIVCRVELIQFMAMRALWFLWLGLLILYVVIQLLVFRRRHYTVVAKTEVIDARDKYLPRKK